MKHQLSVALFHADLTSCFRLPTGIRPWLVNYLANTKTGYTLFVPTNAAFRKAFGPAALAQLAKQPMRLQTILKYNMLNFQATPERMQKDLVGQGYVTFQSKLLQKYKGANPNAMTIGPVGAQTANQVATITRFGLYQDPIAIVNVVDSVLVPK